MAAVRIVAGGDVALGGVLAGLSSEDLQARVEGVASLFRDGDLSVVSLDCAIGTEGEPPHRDEYIVDAPAANLHLLERLGVGVVSLANNHSTDRGRDSLARGRRDLAKLGILAAGAGADEETAHAPVVVDCGGIRTGLLAFASTDPWVGAIAADTNRGGVAPLVAETVLAAVTDLAAQVDAVVVCLHWGKEYIPIPPPDSVRLGRALIDAGALVVLGTHPHVVQPVESYHGGVICYSLGNLLFPSYPEQGLSFRGSGQQSLVATIRVESESATVESLTVVSFDEAGYLSVMAERESQGLLTELERHSSTLGTEAHAGQWHGAVRRHEMARLGRVLREEVLAAGWRGGTTRLLRLGRKNLLSVGRSVREILFAGKAGE